MSEPQDMNPPPAVTRSAIAERFSKNFFLCVTALAFMTFVLILVFVNVGQSVPAALAYSLIFFVVIVAIAVVGASLLEKKVPR